MTPPAIIVSFLPFLSSILPKYGRNTKADAVKKAITSPKVDKSPPKCCAKNGMTVPVMFSDTLRKKASAVIAMYSFVQSFSFCVLLFVSMDNPPEQLFNIDVCQILDFVFFS